MAGISRKGEPARSWHMQLARELFEGRYRSGQRLELREIAAKHKMDDESVLRTFAEFQALGMVTLSGNVSAVFHSRNPKEMQEAYELRAALEEIAGRTAAAALKGNCIGLQREVQAMRAAVADGNLDAYAEHDVNFHRGILKASENDVLLRVWDTLMFDLRIRAAIGTASKDLPRGWNPMNPLWMRWQKGAAGKPGCCCAIMWRRFLKKAESDSGLHKAFRKDLEGAKDV